MTAQLTNAQLKKLGLRRRARQAVLDNQGVLLAHQQQVYRAKQAQEVATLNDSLTRIRRILGKDLDKVAECDASLYMISLPRAPQLSAFSSREAAQLAVRIETLMLNPVFAEVIHNRVGDYIVFRVANMEGTDWHSCEELRMSPRAWDTVRQDRELFRSYMMDLFDRLFEQVRK